MCCGDIASRPKHPTELPAALAKWRGKWVVVLTDCSSYGVFPQFPEGSCIFSVSCLLLEAVHPALSCCTGVTATYIDVYLILLIGGGEFSTLQRRCHLRTCLICLSFSVTSIQASSTDFWVKIWGVSSIMDHPPNSQLTTESIHPHFLYSPFQ